MVKKTPVVDLIDEGIALQGDYYLTPEEKDYIQKEQQKNKGKDLYFDPDIKYIGSIESFDENGFKKGQNRSRG
jgi:hypothetical protein